MNTVSQLAEFLDRSFHGGPWHGPAVAEVLDGVDAVIASTRPVADGHSIWEIVLHLTVWNDVPLRRIDGERVGEVAGRDDWPGIGDPSDERWRAALASLETAHRDLHARVSGLADDDLDRPVTGSEPTVRGLVLGVLQHNAYHAGQITLLKKAAGA